MKYIRTKDNKICLLHEDLFTKGVWWFETKEEVLQISCIPSDFGKVADTIEELCDEFVLVDTESEYCGILPKDKEIKFDKVNMGNAYGRKFYGAIWTKWGLKYVAKMNEQGELELI